MSVVLAVGTVGWLVDAAVPASEGVPFELLSPESFCAAVSSDSCFSSGFADLLISLDFSSSPL